MLALDDSLTEEFPEVEFPRWSEPLFLPKRTKIVKGGRGSAKSWTIARILVLKAAARFERILCAREIQASIRDSVHKLIVDQIELLGLASKFEVTDNAIRHIETGSEFVFKGLRSNKSEIKSFEGVTICWIEEAHGVSAESWALLEPTIRTPGSEIWISYNPDLETDPVHTRFVAEPDGETIILTVNFWDNPWFPEVLRKQMERDRERNYESYLHVWEGHFRKSVEAAVFQGNWKVMEFLTPHDAEFLYGNDWGFARDPNALIRFFIDDAAKTIFIDQEAVAPGVKISLLPELFDTVAGAREHVIRADNSRPELVAHMRDNGFPLIEAAEKWPGSLQDGIETIKDFFVVIHPRCKHTAFEFANYKHKVHRLTKDVLPDIVDADNHCIDAIRYGLEPITRRRKGNWENLI